jgi:hypothetical protein
MPSGPERPRPLSCSAAGPDDGPDAGGCGVLDVAVATDVDSDPGVADLTDAAEAGVALPPPAVGIVTAAAAGSSISISRSSSAAAAAASTSGSSPAVASARARRPPQPPPRPLTPHTGTTAGG